MNWNNHSGLLNTHAFLGASQYSWLNYDEDKLKNAYLSHSAAQRGTELHELAAKMIKLRVKARDNKTSFNRYVNDGIGFDMKPEQVLYYSEFCYGTADTISFNDDFLRVHDLKTGRYPAKMEQLYIYAAIFCLEYKVKPGDIQFETRIYQSNDVRIENPTAEIIAPIMSKIKTFDRILRKMKEDEF